MQKLLCQTYSFTLDFNLRRKVLLTCFNDEKTGLKKSDNLQKSSKMFNDTELVSTRTRIQSLGPTPEPSQLMREERMQSSSFCVGFLFSFTPKAVPFTPNPFFSALHPEGGPLGTKPPGLTFPLPTDRIDGRDWEETEGQQGTESRLCFLYSLPASVSCLWQWLCSSLVTAPIGQGPSVHAPVLFAAAAKSLQSCPTLCDPIDGSPPGFPVPGILQARTLEWVAISFSSKYYFLPLAQGGNGLLL